MTKNNQKGTDIMAISKTLKNRIIDIIKKPKYIFKPIALYTFVLEEKNDLWYILLGMYR